MIDESVVSGLSDDLFRYKVKESLATLASTGVILSQIKLEEARILHGNSEEDITELALKIKNHRLYVARLQELHDLGLKYAEELRS